MRRVLAHALRPSLQAEALRAAAGLVQFLVLARLLGATGFGQLALVTLGAALLQPLLTPSVGLVLVRASAAGVPERRLVRDLVRSCLRAGLMAGALAAVVASTGVLHVPLAAVWLLWWSEIAALGLLGGLAAIAQGRRDFSRYRNLVALVAAVRAGAAASLVLASDVDLRTWAQALALASTPVALAAAWWSRARVAGDDEAGARHDDVWVFSLNAFALRLSDDADKAFVAAYAGYAAAGAYTAAYRLGSYVMVPVRGVLAEFAPALFRATRGAEPGPPQWHQVRSAVGRVLVAVGLAVPPLYVGALLAPRLLGPSYADLARYALVLVPALGLRGVHYVFGDVLTATGRARERLAAQGASVLVPLGACSLLIPPFGAWGAVWATLLGEVLAVVLLWSWARRAVGIATSPVTAT